MNESSVKEAASVNDWGPQALDEAQRTATAIDQLPPGVTIDVAYQLQHGVLARRLARGERVIGTKLGFTSQAKMAQMGVSEIIVGELTDAMQVQDGATLDTGQFVHPRIEPEVAFRIGRDVDLADPDVDIVACLDAVGPALEIIDSRYRDFRFSLPDVIADNTSAAAFVIGPWSEIDTDLGERAVSLLVDGEVVESDTTAAILGHPLAALRALVPLARKYNFALPAGQIVLAGAATAAVALRPSTVSVQVAGLGTASVRVTNG